MADPKSRQECNDDPNYSNGDMVQDTVDAFNEGTVSLSEAAETIVDCVGEDNDPSRYLDPYWDR